MGNNTIFLSDSLKDLIDEKYIEQELTVGAANNVAINNVYDNSLLEKVLEKKDKLVLKFLFENKEQKDIALLKFKKREKNLFLFETKINTDETVYFLQNIISQVSFYINDLLIQQFNSFQFDIYYSVSYINSNNYNLKIKIQKRVI